MTVKNKAAYFLVFMIFTSCAHYSTTQKNIKKVNAAFEVKKTTAPALVTPNPVQLPPVEQTGAIPLSQFLDARTPTALQSTNPWFSKLQEWSRIYLDIAKAEKDVRNYTLSAKYSSLAAMWADRALEIKDLSTLDAIFKVKIWLDGLKLPKLPATSGYFAAQDVYAKIYITRNTLKDFKNGLCLISRGIPIVATTAYLDLSIDLYNQKKYVKALSKIQNGLASIESVKPEDDKKCTNPNEEESNEAK